MSDRPRLLDLFCGAGGAAMGYHRAGFDVVGVDIKPQPHYQFEFIQADALEFLRERLVDNLGWRFDAIHASPPCQAYTRAGALRTNKRDHPELIRPTRELLKATGLPYVIENVPGAPLRNPVQLCNTGFFPRGNGLDWELQRHRLFEANFPLIGVGCHHTSLPTISVVGHGATKATRTRLGRNPAIAEKRRAMGIGWMNRDELSEAIPPCYTEWIGDQLLDHIQRVAA
jgi:DNA (cytosine-5)-methyltransferase 1